MRRALWVFAAAFGGYLVSSGFGHTAYDNYVLLANAWVHGSLTVADPGPAIDALHYMGRYYIIEAPLPAVLMLPLVALFGTAANQSLVCVVCGAVAVAAADAMFGRMELSAGGRYTALAAFACGTVLWWCTAFGAVWMYAHVAGVMFAMLALAELYGARRPWLVGLLLACAALSRLPMALAIPPMLWWVTQDCDGRLKARRFWAFVAGAAPLFVAYAAYNFARWGTPLDIGYTVWYHQDQVGQPTGSPFRLEYLPFNLYSFLMLAPDFARNFPWLRPSSFGVSLTLTSPMLLLALAAPRGCERRPLGIAALLVAAPSMLYYVNGFEQFGMRHSLDFMPFLMPLVGRGLGRVPSGLAMPLVVSSIAANAYGMWYSWAYHAYSVVPRS
ncbi:MAG: hypothetical protein M3T49_05700 [Candidatus Eremiobacteraeota bacterium]|nr:hypothetical protein [Candidatus Eremiobacteraeota bacterium]